MDFFCIDSQIIEGPSGYELARGCQDLALIRNAWDVQFAIGDRQNERWMCVKLFPSLSGLSSNKQSGPSLLNLVDEVDAREVELFGKQTPGLTCPPITGFASHHNQVIISKLANSPGQNLSNRQRVRIWLPIIDDQHCFICFHGKCLAQCIFRAFSPEREDGDAASRALAQLQRSLECVFTEDVRYELSIPANDFEFLGVDSKIAGGDFWVNYLFKANNNLHDDFFVFEAVGRL